jgi:hypothetical protein
MRHGHHAQPTTPLFFISGGSDHILPPVILKHNHRKNAKHSRR